MLLIAAQGDGCPLSASGIGGDIRCAVRRWSIQLLVNPTETRFIPNWRRVDAPYPDLLRQLHQAEQFDNS
jgi:hypothetical protein